VSVEGWRRGFIESWSFASSKLKIYGESRIHPLHRSSTERELLPLGNFAPFFHKTNTIFYALKRKKAFLAKKMSMFLVFVLGVAPMATVPRTNFIRLWPRVCRPIYTQFLKSGLSRVNVIREKRNLNKII